MIDLTTLFTNFTPENLSNSVPVLILFLALSATLYLISLYTKKPITLKLGVFTINFGKAQEENVVNNEEEVKGAKRNKMVMEKLKSFVISRERQVHRLQHDILVRQFNFCDEKLVEMKDVFLDEYSRILSKKLPPEADARNHPNFRNYKMMLELMLEYCVKKLTFDKSVRQNHLAELTMDSWESFVEQKVNITLALIKSYYDDNYPDESIVTRKELAESDKVFEKIRPMIISMYRKAREISIDVKSKIRYIEEEIDKAIKNETFDTLCMYDTDD